MLVARLGTIRLSPSDPMTSTMRAQDRAPSRWANLPISLRAVISGLLITLAAVIVWPQLLLNLGVPLVAFAEAIFLGLFLWWTGGGPPHTTKPRISPQPGQRREWSPSCLAQAYYWGFLPGPPDRSFPG